MISTSDWMTTGQKNNRILLQHAFGVVFFHRCFFLVGTPGLACSCYYKQTVALDASAVAIKLLLLLLDEKESINHDTS